MMYINEDLTLNITAANIAFVNVSALAYLIRIPGLQLFSI
jgi:hypothetical protein